MTDHKGLNGISTEACQLAKAMKDLEIPRLVNKGLIEITIKFHEACPFHDPVSYAIAEKPSPYHIPLRDVEHIWRILDVFRWILQPIDIVADLRKLATFPNIAWTAPYSRGRFSGADFGADFLFNLTLLDVWVRSTQSRSHLPDQAWTLFSDTRGHRYKYDLGWWLARFNNPQYLSYYISPPGKVTKLQRDHIGMMVDVYEARAADIAVFDPVWTDSSELVHEVKLITSVLLKMRQKLDSAISSLDQFQLLVADARMEAFQPILSAILAEMKVLRCSSYAAPASRSLIEQATDRIHGQSMNLKRLGLWGGKWKNLNEGNHVVTRGDEQLEHFWCRCGSAISLSLKEIVGWKEQQGMDVEELARQMQGTDFGLDLRWELEQGYFYGYAVGAELLHGGNTA